MADEVAVRLGAVAARDRDVELGIAPHTVLGDVEAGRLRLLLDPDPPQALKRPEAAERGGERERSDRGEAEELYPDLVERAGVDEPAAASLQRRGKRWHGEEAGSEGAPDARNAVDGHRADWVVDADPFDRQDDDDRDHSGHDADHHGGPRRDEA